MGVGPDTIGFIIRHSKILFIDIKHKVKNDAMLLQYSFNPITYGPTCPYSIIAYFTSCQGRPSAGIPSTLITNPCRVELEIKENHSEPLSFCTYANKSGSKAVNGRKAVS